jgi:hypothetical protein
MLRGPRRHASLVILVEALNGAVAMLSGPLLAAESRLWLPNALRGLRRRWSSWGTIEMWKAASAEAGGPIIVQLQFRQPLQDVSKQKKGGQVVAEANVAWCKGDCSLRSLVVGEFGDA